MFRTRLSPPKKPPLLRIPRACTRGLTPTPIGRLPELHNQGQRRGEHKPSYRKQRNISRMPRRCSPFLCPPSLPSPCCPCPPSLPSLPSLPACPPSLPSLPVCPPSPPSPASCFACLASNLYYSTPHSAAKKYAQRTSFAMHTLHSCYSNVTCCGTCGLSLPPDAHVRLGVRMQLAVQVQVLSPPPRPLKPKKIAGAGGVDPLRAPSPRLRAARRQPLRGAAAATARRWGWASKALSPNAGGGLF